MLTASAITPPFVGFTIYAFKSLFLAYFNYKALIMNFLSTSEGLKAIGLPHLSFSICKYLIPYLMPF